MFSKFQRGLSQRAPCTDPSGVTDKGWIVESLEIPVSRQCWWAKSCSFGQNLMESYSCAEILQGIFIAKFLTGNSIVRGWVFMLQGAALSSTSTTLPRSDNKELGTHPLWGGQEAAAFPLLHPDISPASLQHLWKSSTAGFSLTASCLKKCREKIFFSTSSADRTIRNLSKGIGRSAHQHTMNEKTALFPPPHADTSPQGCCRHWVSLLTLEDWCSGGFFAPWWAYLQCISASRPKARGDGFGIAKLSYFSRNRPASALTLRTDTRFGAGAELTPARWAQNQEPSPSIKVHSKALLLMNFHGHLEQRITSTSVQFSLRCSPEDIGKSFNDMCCPVRGGQGRDERKAPDLSGERHMPLSNK